MHIEKKNFDNIFNTVMNVKGKTKDNAKSREDLKEFCHRPELHRDENANKYPKACYTLDKDGKEQLCKWIKKLKFPHGYVSNLGRCVDLGGNKLYGMKSHDSLQENGDLATKFSHGKNNSSQNISMSNKILKLSPYLFNAIVLETKIKTLLPNI